VNQLLLADARAGFRAYVESMVSTDGGFSLTREADHSPYSWCFGLFGRHLGGDPTRIDGPAAHAVRLAESVRVMRRASSGTPRHKAYRQLLTFSLSALHLLDALRDDPLDDLVREQVPSDVARELAEMGCLEGRAGSGNQAMFQAIFLLHARDYLGMDTQPALDEWVALHLKHMNRFGFWGDDRWMTHLQFQNGYHQHEILEYLGVDNPRQEAALAAVRSLVDDEGHFAPYPGGGGCYDYDAVFMLTPHGRIPDEATRRLLASTAATLLAEQNPDGGFCESHRVRPRSWANLTGFTRHVWAARGNRGAFRERLRYALTLQRPKHDRIHTHWSRYSRRWDESDLWDSWFRMLALARIDVTLHPVHAANWGFIDYPGIGYHPSLRDKARMG
jgi:hypothetical protein